MVAVVVTAFVKVAAVTSVGVYSGGDGGVSFGGDGDGGSVGGCRVLVVS